MAEFGLICLEIIRVYITIGFLWHWLQEQALVTSPYCICKHAVGHITNLIRAVLNFQDESKVL